jgi:hypothetical protein
VSRPGVASPLPDLAISPEKDQEPAAAVACPTTTAVLSGGRRVQLWDTASQGAAVRGRSFDEASNVFTGEEPASMTGGCLLAEATNNGLTDDVRLWDARAARQLARL